MPHLPIIKNVTDYRQKEGLTTIFFQCDLLNGQRLLNRSWQINDYEMHWYYKQLGWDQRYFPFTDFWSGSTEKEKLDFLFIFISDEKAWIASGIRAKVLNEPKMSRTAIIHLLKWAS